MSTTPFINSSSKSQEEAFANQSKLALYQLASYLTDPLCNAHENFRRFALIDHLYPTADKVGLFIKKLILVLKMVGSSLLATVTTLPGIGIRSLLSNLQQEPYIYLRSTAKEKELENQSFSLLSWNICAVAGGYSMTDGGVLHWQFRKEKIVNTIKESGCDIVTLYETFDTESAIFLWDIFRHEGYVNFYFNIGSQGIGVSSGMMVMSKFKIDHFAFHLFPKETLVGRTKFAAKGVVIFDVTSNNEGFATIGATHLQHSEEPAFPAKEEIESRKEQMEIIIEELEKSQQRCIILTGDQNLDDEELKTSFWSSRFEKRDVYEGFTWGGDQFCAQMVGKRASSARNLDHTLVLKPVCISFETTTLETNFEGSYFNPEASSDHKPIKTLFNLNS